MFPETAYDPSGSATAADPSDASPGKVRSFSSGGGWGLILPVNGESRKPGQAAGMLTLFGIIFLVLIKKGARSHRTVRPVSGILIQVLICIDSFLLFSCGGGGKNKNPFSEEINKVITENRASP